VFLQRKDCLSQRDKKAHLEAIERSPRLESHPEQDFINSDNVRSINFNNFLIRSDVYSAVSLKKLIFIFYNIYILFREFDTNLKKMWE